MKNMLITLAILIIVALLLVIGCLVHVGKKSPSIMNGGYDAEMHSKQTDQSLDQQ